MKYLIAAFCLALCLCTAASAQQWNEVSNSDDVFQAGYIQVVVESESGQSRFKAQRAAEVLAQRRLLEVVQGIQLSGATQVRDGMTASDAISTSVQGTLQGAVICGEDYDTAERYARVCMKLALRGDNSLFQSLYPAIRQQPEVLRMPPAPQYAPSAEAAPTPAPTPPVHDGVIIDARRHPFRPALVNRILSDTNQVLFEPSRVENSILIERGCGGYTTDMAKAKALLSSWGSNAPLTVTVNGVANKTDAVVSAKDALAIFENDAKANILANARVVFVLK